MTSLKQKPPDDHSVACADYFFSVVKRHFPEVIMEDGITEQGRLMWKITLPYQYVHSIKGVDDVCAELQDRIFMTHGRLIAYIITQEEYTW